MQNQPRFYAFDERIAFADGHAPSIEAMERILMNRIPGCCDIERANLENDKSGTDYFAYRNGNAPLRIDLKLRDQDWSVRGCDDLALEIWSVMPSQTRCGKVGWSRDADKNTDYVLWYWRDTGRFFLISFHALCFCFSKFWQVWMFKYKTAIQSSDGWQSQCVYVPRDVLLKTIERWQHSNINCIA